MLDAHSVSFGFLIVSGLLSLGLLGFAIRGFRRSHESGLAFVAGAFTIFAIKSFLVAYALRTGSIEHERLELVDAMGDLATVLIFVAPLFWPMKTQ